MIAKFEIRLGDADWETYGGPEWLTFDPDAFDDMAFDDIHKLERAMGVSIAVVRQIEIPAFTALGFRAAAWLARRQAGIEAPSWDAFKPKPLQLRTRRPGGDDGDPPDPGSSPSSSESAASPTSTRSRSRSSAAPGK